LGLWWDLPGRKLWTEPLRLMDQETSVNFLMDLPEKKVPVKVKVWIGTVDFLYFKHFNFRGAQDFQGSFDLPEAV